MGEQFIDLFTAGSYALVSRLYEALAQPAFSWLFYSLATLGMLYAIMISALENRPDFWLRHLAAVCLASILTLVPAHIPLGDLGYGAPGKIETLFGTHTGAAPHLTYWIERLGAHAAVSLRDLTHKAAVLVVPGVAAQVHDMAANPATLDDAQLRANLEIWRRRVVPQILADDPDLASRIRKENLLTTLMHPVPSLPDFFGEEGARESERVVSALNATHADVYALVRAQDTLLRKITDDAGAQAWEAQAEAQQGVRVLLSRYPSIDPPRALNAPAPAFDDALRRADAVTTSMRDSLGRGDVPVTVHSLGELYIALGKSILYNAGVRIAHDNTARASLGSLCQHNGNAACRAALAPLQDAAAELGVPDADHYNTASWITLLEQPVATILLTVTSLLLGTLSTLVVCVLPFALGTAKAIAIVISVLGAWLLLWPGRARIALSWMVAPIAFVSLWSVLFNLWSDIEPRLSEIASVVGGSDHGSWSAGRAMSIAIALGYMGLPSLALGLIYGESGRALYHASARMETALLMAWHTRGSVLAMGKRWFVNSPMARRINQRAYRAIGIGTLRSSKAAGGSSARARAAKPISGAKPSSGTKGMAPRSTKASGTKATG